MKFHDDEIRRVQARLDEVEQLRAALERRNTSEAATVSRQLAELEDDDRAVLRDLRADAEGYHAESLGRRSVIGSARSR